jgi:hypothetical protein
MSEGELDRLRRVVERLMAGHREALGVIDQEVENQESSAQETLAEVQDILSGAYEDARTILGGEEGQGSMTDRSRPDEERERPSREDDEKRREAKERRSSDLQEAWRRNHPSEQEEGRQGRPKKRHPA